MINIGISRKALPARRQSLLVMLSNVIAVAKQRRTLRALDPHQLADIGISRQDANAEASRSVWDVPSTWRY